MRFKRIPLYVANPATLTPMTGDGNRSRGLARPRLEAAGLRVTGTDPDGEPRIVELAGDVHPFFLATLFIPQASLHAGMASCDCQGTGGSRHRSGDA